MNRSLKTQIEKLRSKAIAISDQIPSKYANEAHRDCAKLSDEALLAKYSDQLALIKSKPEVYQLDEETLESHIGDVIQVSTDIELLRFYLPLMEEFEQISQQTTDELIRDYLNSL